MDPADAIPNTTIKLTVPYLFCCQVFQIRSGFNLYSIGPANPDPDWESGSRQAKAVPLKIKNKYKISFFKTLNVLYTGLRRHI
jgi:hypothetical protein